MGLGEKILASIISVSLFGGSPKCENAKIDNFEGDSNTVENVVSKDVSLTEKDNLSNSSETTRKQISICLSLDDENSFTHTKALEKVLDPENTVLEYPAAQLFQKYGNHNHPFVVSGVKKDFRALLGKEGIERLTTKTHQKLATRPEKITSDTKYEMRDTLRFLLIDPLLKDDFPHYLSDQLKEDGFESFSDPDASILDKIISDKNTFKNSDKKTDFIYDVVVKKVPSGKSALALYRNGELFMATYASVGCNDDRKTKTGQYKVLGKEPYKRSRKYGNAPMPEALNFCGGFYIHQGNVSGYPLSHGCVRIPGVFADVLYSSVKNTSSVDVFVSKNLYK